MCSPAVKAVSCAGELQPANAAPSSEHAKLTSCSPAAKPKTAVAFSVATGGLSVTSVPGGVVSTDHVWTAGEASRLPAWSVARTRNSCDPTASPVYSRGDEQAAKAAPSSEHSNVEPVSVAVNVNDAVVSRLAAPGCEPIELTGASTS